MKSLKEFISQARETVKSENYYGYYKDEIKESYSYYNLSSSEMAQIKGGDSNDCYFGCLAYIDEVLARNAGTNFTIGAESFRNDYETIYGKTKGGAIDSTQIGNAQEFADKYFTTYDPTILDPSYDSIRTAQRNNYLVIATYHVGGCTNHAIVLTGGISWERGSDGEIIPSSVKYDYYDPADGRYKQIEVNKINGVIDAISDYK